MSEDQKPQEQTPVDRFHDRVGKLDGGVPGRPILGAAEERHTAGIPGNTIGGSTSNPWASLDEECKRIREELRLSDPRSSSSTIIRAPEPDTPTAMKSTPTSNSPTATRRT